MSVRNTNKMINLLFVFAVFTCAVGEYVPKTHNPMKNENSEFIAFPDELDVGPTFQQQQQYHHHHPGGYHQHGYHHEHEFSSGRPSNGDSGNVSRKIPLDFIQNINKYNVSDLLLNFVEGEADEDPFIKNRFGGDDDDERSGGKMAKSAVCMPELKTIQIVKSDDPSVLYIPQCTRVERCGGCCSHTLLSCQPAEGGIESVTFQVLKTQYTGSKKLKYLGKQVIAVEKHTKCKCDCKIKAKDCNTYQEYRKNDCRCACKNIDEEKKCNKSNFTKLWDPEVCACRCREISQCSTGSLFDHNECKCVAESIKRRFASYERKGYRSEALPVIPLYDDEY